jgi:4-hydroxy-tetrahydrodipicolinate synthase
MLAIGAKGVISVAANLVPHEVISMIDAYQSGDIHKARQYHADLFPLCRALMDLAPNPVPLKTALSMVGRGNGELRLPLTPMNSRERDILSVRLSCDGLRILEAGAGA